MFRQIKLKSTMLYHRFAPRIDPGNDMLVYWRHRVLTLILFIGVSFGLIVIMATFPLLVEKGLWGLLFFDCMVWLACLTMLVSTKMPLRPKVLCCMAILYSTGLLILHNLGPMSGGPVWLFCLPIFAGVFLGPGASVASLLVNGLTLLILGVLVNHGIWGEAFPFFSSFQHMLTTGMNFLFFNSLTAISVSVLVQGLLNTRQKEAELTNSLLASNQRFHSLADAAMEGILFIREGVCLQANKSAALLFGHAFSEGLNGVALLDLISSKDHDLVSSKVLGAGGASYEAKGRRRDNSMFPILIRSRQMGFQDLGQVHVVTIEDLTEQKRSEKINKTLFAISNAVSLTRDLDELFRQIRHLLGKILDTTNFYIALVDQKHETLRFSYFVDEMDSKVPSPTKRDARDSLTGLVAREQKPVMLRKRALERLGRDRLIQGARPLVWMGVPLMIQDEVIGVTAVQSYGRADLYDDRDLELFSSVSGQIAIAIDRKRSEDALRESEGKYRYLFDNAPAAIYEIDFTKEKFVNVNEAMCIYSGYSKEEFLSMHPIDLLTEESKPLFYEHYKKLLKQQDLAKTYDFQILKKNKEILSVVLNTDFIFENGRVKGARVVVHDVTERKKFEEMMIRSEKMISVGGLAAGMAHEINNPLAGMIQNAQVIHSRLTRKMAANETAAEELGLSMEKITAFMEKRGIFRQLEHIGSAGSRAAKIVENMLSFAGDNDSVKSVLPLKLLLEDTISLAVNDFDLKKKHHINDITIQTAFGPESLEIRCEGSKLQQVFFNLIKNAVEAMAAGSEQEKGLTLVVRLKDQGDFVCIEFDDNGPGMEENIRKRVFEPFFTTKGVDEGTGLGLAISYYIIVEDHGGQLDVESSPGKGCRFIITLPKT